MATRSNRFDRKGLGTRVAALRRRAHLSQERLAEVIGVGSATISRLERGQTIPSVETLAKVAGAVHVDLPDLFDRSQAATRRDEAIEALVVELKTRSERDVLLVHDVARRFFEELPKRRKRR